MGRPVGSVAGGRQVDPVVVVQWRKGTGASIAKTSAHFGLSTATVKRYCGAVASGAAHL